MWCYSKNIIHCPPWIEGMLFCRNYSWPHCEVWFFKMSQGARTVRRYSELSGKMVGMRFWNWSKWIWKFPEISSRYRSQIFPFFFISERSIIFEHCGFQCWFVSEFLKLYVVHFSCDMNGSQRSEMSRIGQLDCSGQDGRITSWPPRWPGPVANSEKDSCCNSSETNWNT